MAVTCTSSAWATGGACYRREIIGPKAQKALLVYASALVLDAAIATTYATTLSTTLIEDATAAFCGMTDEHYKAGLIDTVFDDSSDATTLAEKMEVVKCLLSVDDKTLDMLLYYLLCRYLKGS